MDWIDAEIDALDEQLATGQISREYHWDEVLRLRAIAKHEQERQDVIDAGRGHLLK